MSTVHEIRLRSNRFVEQLPMYIEDVVNDNQALLDLNREQLREEHKTAKDQPIRPEYSPWTARLKGFKTPDLYDTGDMQRTMQIEAKGEAYHIRGTTDYTDSLISRYGADIFGVARSMSSRAKAITSGMLAELYKKFVLNG